MQVYNPLKRNPIRFLVPMLALVLLVFSSCKKEYIYQYEVDDVNVSQPGAVKPNVKSDIEFISVAYTDVFGSIIPQNELDDLALSYAAFGDKTVIIDMIIRNFLNDPDVDVPSTSEMNADVNVFVEATFQKFFVRKPSEFEKWFVKDKIQSDANMTPELVYYAFMTSNEYRYY